jgi:hypothetical protein
MPLRALKQIFDGTFVLTDQHQDLLWLLANNYIFKYNQENRYAVTAKGARYCVNRQRKSRR